MNPYPAALLFLADATPNWTDKEVLIAVGSVAGSIISICLAAFRYMTWAARRRTRWLQKECAELRGRIKELENSDNRPDIRELREKLVKTEADLKALEMNKAATVEKIHGDLEEAQESLEKHAGDLAGERRRIEKALRKDGRTWTEKVMANAPEFKPLDPDGRRMPIISVLNLKGGVGKTTITANLGAALDARGYRTLLVDLDLQGSLTGLFLPEPEQYSLLKEEKLLGDFLASSFDAEHPNLLQYTRGILTHGRSALVPTADELAYAEMNLTIRWLLREVQKDPRMLLRKELHMRRIVNSYDVVLLDCPPLINVCCVNALAASDYVLIPIMPSKQATARVTILLERLKEIRDNINPSLKVMGIVCNRTQRSELTIEEQNRLLRLSSQCFDLWGEDVRQLETFIRQSREVRAAEDERRPLGDGDEMREVFTALAEEVESRMPMFCRPAAKATDAQEVSS